MYVVIVGMSHAFTPMGVMLQDILTYHHSGRQMRADTYLCDHGFMTPKAINKLLQVSNPPQTLPVSI